MAVEAAADGDSAAACDVLRSRLAPVLMAELKAMFGAEEEGQQQQQLMVKSRAALRALRPAGDPSGLLALALEWGLLSQAEGGAPDAAIRRAAVSQVLDAAAELLPPPARP